MIRLKGVIAWVFMHDNLWLYQHILKGKCFDVGGPFLEFSFRQLCAAQSVAQFWTVFYHPYLYYLQQPKSYLGQRPTSRGPIVTYPKSSIINRLRIGIGWKTSYCTVWALSMGAKPIAELLACSEQWQEGWSN